MYIEKLKLRNFRNYTAAELEFSPLTNIIYGNNAQGKTNILEAVYLFSQGRSHRAKTDKELIIFRDSFGSSLVPLLVKDYRTVTVVDIRYVASDFVGNFVDFHGQDVLLLYSTLILNNSNTLK